MACVQRILDQVAQQPGRPWLIEIHGTTPLPVRGRTLLQWVGQYRAGLTAAGVAPGDRVALVAPNSAYWVAADLAILAHGAVTVPLYARQARGYLINQLVHADPAFVFLCGAGTLTPEDLTRELGALMDKAPPIVELKAWVSGSPSASQGVVPATRPEAVAPVGEDDLATIIYTSGTSGEAKGVMLSHGNLDTMLTQVEGALNDLIGGSGHEEAVFHYLPFCFAGSRIAVLCQLLRNNSVSLSTDLSELPQELKAAAPHYFLNVPMLLERMKRTVEEELQRRSKLLFRGYERALAAYRAEQAGRATLADGLALRAARRTLFPALKAGLGINLRFLICGSAPLSPETQAWFEMLSVPVYQVYGLTETTAIVSLDDATSPLGGTVGKPLPVGHCRITSSGELQVKGPHVFRGYFRNPAATAEVFEDGWFKTGDLAAFDEAGRLRILGRAKNLIVPASGHNVAPEPIEEALITQLRGLENAVVVGDGRPYLTVLLAGRFEAEAAEAALARVNAELPHYQQLRAYAHVGESLRDVEGVFTSNQKLRRGAFLAHYEAEIDALYRRQRTSSGVVRVSADRASRLESAWAWLSRAGRHRKH